MIDLHGFWVPSLRRSSPKKAGLRFEVLGKSSSVQSCWLACRDHNMTHFLEQVKRFFRQCRKTRREVMKPFHKVLLVAGILLVTALIVVYFRERLFKPVEEAPQEQGVGSTESPISEAPLPVNAAPARRGEVVLRISATGLTHPKREVLIGPKVSGKIVTLAAVEGKAVRQGQLLLKLDDREYRLALAEARSALLDAQVQYGLLKTEQRTTVLGDTAGNLPSRLDVQAAKRRWEEVNQRGRDKEISEEEYERARLHYETALIFSGEKREELMANKSGLAKALITLKRAELNLSYTEIRAPFSGIVRDVKVEKGQHVSQGQECFKLLDLSEVGVELSVLESEIGLVKEGRKADVTFAAYPGEVFHGGVVSVNPRVDAETKTCRVRVRLVNPQGKLKAGMYAFAKLEAQVFHNRFIVPKEAVLVRDNRKLVFIVREGLAKCCYVDMRLEDEHSVEVIGSSFDLKEGELVITSGHYTLAHDAPVKVVEK